MTSIKSILIVCFKGKGLKNLISITITWLPPKTKENIENSMLLLDMYVLTWNWKKYKTGLKWIQMVKVMSARGSQEG